MSSLKPPLKRRCCHGNGKSSSQQQRRCVQRFSERLTWSWQANNFISGITSLTSFINGCGEALFDHHSRRMRVAPRFSVDLNQNIEYIPEQPEWAGYRDPTPPSPPPSVDEYSPGQTQSVPSVPSAGTSSSRGSKRKAPMVDVINSQFDKLTTSLDGFANVLSSSNVHFGVISDAVVRQVSAMEDRNKILRRNPNYTYTEADIYEMLNSMHIADENLLDQCYDFLCGNPTCTRRLMGLPPHKRWNKLCKMISDGNC
ncbi:uncharacterized protein HKW66_Vig0255150 [Vigna angularis]|uniref:Uncharacterized protein n=1 Tax=Phaseolus angularis TaxID=3914 RepID=A0A8T0JSK3_PHAAN|nr:uncharacterized protein HKW66_Vig0255150 [Vigna angularis]